MSTEVSSILPETPNDILYRILKTLKSTDSALPEWVIQIDPKANSVRQESSQNYILECSSSIESQRKVDYGLQLCHQVQKHVSLLLEYHKSTHENMEQSLQRLQEKVRKQIKFQLESNLMIEAYQEDLDELRKQNLNLKAEISVLQQKIDRFQEDKEKCECINSIQHTQSTGHNYLNDVKLRTEKDNERYEEKIKKSSNLVSQIKNRLSLCNTDEVELKFRSNNHTVEPSSVKQAVKEIQTHHISVQNSNHKDEITVPQKFRKTQIHLKKESNRAVQAQAKQKRSSSNEKQMSKQKKLMVETKSKLKGKNEHTSKSRIKKTPSSSKIVRSKSKNSYRG